MYVWLAIDINDQLKNIRDKIAKISNKLNVDNLALTLPLHVSLLISFPIDDLIFESIVKRIGEYYSNLAQFTLKTRKIAKCDNIVWLLIKGNRKLKKIHSDLLRLLQKEYRIHPTDMDLKFLFHSTLFMNNDKSKVDDVYNCLKNEAIPNKLLANKLLIGCSKTGRAGDFEIVKEFLL